jgi:Flp pilus assembly protein TadG
MTAIAELVPTTEATRKFSIRRFWRRRDGVAAMEFGLVVVPFLALILAILQVALVTLAQSVLETATEESTRLILTGQASAQNMSQTQFVNLVCSNLVSMFNCSNLMVDVQSVGSFATANTAAPTLTFNGNGSVSNAWSYNLGSAGSIVVARVMYQWPILLGPLGINLSNLSNGNHLLLATAVFENEP